MAYVYEDDEVMLISQQGMILRMKAGDVRVIGRATQGVRLIEMEEGDQVVAIAKLVERDEEPPMGRRRLRRHRLRSEPDAAPCETPADDATPETRPGPRSDDEDARDE